MIYGSDGTELGRLKGGSWPVTVSSSHYHQAGEQDSIGLADEQRICGSQFSTLDRHGLHSRCVLRCGEHWMFTGSQKLFVKVWMVTWASLCLLATGLTLVTFLLDGRRFAYPKRPLVFIAFCQFLYAVAHLLPVTIGRERAACQPLTNGQSVHVMHSLSNPWCVVNFVLQYYSAMASVICWLILTITWYLAAARKWSQEAIGRLSSTFHILAWAVPAVLTVIVMVTNEVEANELTSLCFVCTHSRSALYAFYVGPLGVLLMVGMVFMMAGINSMLHISKDMRSRACDADLHKLRQLMTKVCVFSLLYFFATLTVLVCATYEKLNADLWRNCSGNFSGPSVQREASAYCPDKVGSVTTVSASSLHLKPVTEICMLRIAMSMLVGIASCLWVWSKKTLQTWRQFFTRPFWTSHCAKPLVQYAPGCQQQVTTDSPQASRTGQPSAHCYYFLLRSNGKMAPKR